jgi:hypothetical protein
MQKIMEYKGFKARIMEAERLVGDSNHNLPPGTPLDVYPSDIFVEYPEQWVKGPGVFVVPVRANKGLWFDWTMNSSINTAVLPTVKGCNPITGLKTSGFHLESYEDKCPAHNVKFEGDRYCPECGYKWPAQNFISYPNTLWLDGFRSKDGVVRQFFFTEDEIRDIASHLIGKENTVPAFGFAFYQPKELRNESNGTYSQDSTQILGTLYQDYFLYKPHPYYVPKNFTYISSTRSQSYSGSSSGGIVGSKSVKYRSVSEAIVSSSLGVVSSYNASSGGDRDLSYSVGCCESLQEVKEVSVGAGAKINQYIQKDPYSLDSWRDTPSAAMTIYFVFQNELDRMLSKGVKDFEGKKEGMLEGLQIG